jgi:predicted AAA+ superfamily ATPase
MDQRFSVHNTHWNSANPIKSFSEQDPQLKQLKTLPYVFYSGLLQELPISIPGIYTVGGGRQIGKTTLLKQWMYNLMNSGIHPNSILFLTGEMIEDHYNLVKTIQSQLALMNRENLCFLIVDEITYIKDWDKGIKFLADGGILERVVLILTGSDLVLMQEARMRFPGRRGKADKVDFHFYPLSFKEFVDLKKEDNLYAMFNSYLLHGGFLTAINDLAQHKRITPTTLATYSDWVRGDCLKRGKSEHYLKEFFEVMVKTYGTQVSWNALCQHVSIEHPKTIQEYAELLESMDTLFIQHALLEHKLTAAPKKAKKLYFKDPFIYHAIRMWIDPNYKPLSEISIIPFLVETCVITHICRYYQTYYIKAEGEVDVAYIKDKNFWPIEIKWTNQLRSKDLKQIQKYKNGIILSKSKENSMIHEVPSYPLPEFLYNIFMH